MTCALVLFSGGQDSATCLAWALSRFEHVETIGFDYGQRHRVELDFRQTFMAQLRKELPALSSNLGDDTILNLAVLNEISDTSLTREREITMLESGLPSTFVPGRNLLFLTLAAALAYRRDIKHIVTGVCETDYSGYPDCRDDTIKSLQASLNRGMESRLVLDTPLMWLNKADTWALADELGGEVLVELIRSGTLTCYQGITDKMHDWGRGCGSCPACDLRRHGFESWTRTQMYDDSDGAQPIGGM